MQFDILLLSNLPSFDLNSNSNQNINYKTISKLITFLKSYNQVSSNNNSLDDVKNDTNSTLILSTGEYYITSFQNIDNQRLDLVIELLNSFNILVSGVGMHIFDLDINNLLKYLSASNFKHILTNLILPDGLQLYNTLSEWIINIDGMKIGIIYLIDEDFYDSLPTKYKMLRYKDWKNEVARIFALRNAKKCNFIIVLASMAHDSEVQIISTLKVDIVISSKSIYYSSESNILKSDPLSLISIKSQLHLKRNLSESDLSTPSHCTKFNRRSLFAFRTPEIAWNYSICPVAIEILTPDTTTSILLEKFKSSTFEASQKVLFFCDSIIETEKSKLRLSESNFANFVTDYLRKIYSTDIAFLNAGCFSSISNIPAGEVNLDLLCQLFKFHDPIVLTQISGKKIWEALENGLKHLPFLHGSFPHLSGIRYEYSLTTESRIQRVYIFHPSTRAINSYISMSSMQPFSETDYLVEFCGTLGRWEPITNDDTRMFTMATRSYIANGHDGYLSLSCPPILKSNDDIIYSLVRYFDAEIKTPVLSLNFDGRVKCIAESDDSSCDISSIPESTPRKPFKFNILHFNDVYQLESTRKEEPVGGFSRFHTVIEDYRSSHFDIPTILLFSGDCFSPSTHSIITKGKHMIEPLNCLNIDAACLGNHDLDFGFDVATVLLAQTNFPWVLSNVVNAKNNLPLVGTHLYTVINKGGIRIGIIGLAEKEWIDTLAYIPDFGLKFIDFIMEGDRLAFELKTNNLCDFVICLSHMRLPNDIIAATSLKNVDLVLGGHDHDYYCGNFEGKTLVKSGSEFRNLSFLQVNVSYEINNHTQIKTDLMQDNIVGPWSFTFRDDSIKEYQRIVSTSIRRIDVISSIQELESSKKLVFSLTSEIDKSMDKIIGYSKTDLDARFLTTRSSECNWANFVTDLLRSKYDVDLGFIVGGTVRSDNLYPAGPITLRTIFLCYPFDDPTTVIRINSNQLWDCLENGFYGVPKFEGRFPHFSGLKVSYNSNFPAGSRVISVKVFHPAQRNQSPFLQYSSLQPFSTNSIPSSQIAIFKGQKGKWIDVNRDDNLFFTMITRSYIATGKDGFSMLAECQSLLDADCGCIIGSMLRNYFSELKVVTKWQRNFSIAYNKLISPNFEQCAKSKENWGKLCSFVFKNSILNKFQSFNVFLTVSTDMDIERSAFEHGVACIAPACDGRIIKLV